MAPAKYVKKIKVKDTDVYAIFYNKPNTDYNLEAEVKLVQTPITQSDWYGHWVGITKYYPINKSNDCVRYLPDTVMDVWTKVKYGEVFYTTDKEKFKAAQKELYEKMRQDYEHVRFIYESMRRMLNNTEAMQLQYEVDESYYATEDEEDKEYLEGIVVPHKKDTKSD